MCPPVAAHGVFTWRGDIGGEAVLTALPSSVRQTSGDRGPACAGRSVLRPSNIQKGAIVDLGTEK